MLNHKQRVAANITLIAGGMWAIDFMTKKWAQVTLPNHPMLVIRDFLYCVIGTNTGGSNGISPQFAEFCIAIPATIMFCAALWIGRRLRAGKKISLLQQIGFGVFMGGSLGNWSERVIHHGVTDFIYLQPFGFCIFNLADVMIDCGNLIVIVETVRILYNERAARAAANSVLTNSSSSASP